MHSEKVLRFENIGEVTPKYKEGKALPNKRYQRSNNFEHCKNIAVWRKTRSAVSAFQLKQQTGVNTGAIYKSNICRFLISTFCYVHVTPALTNIWIIRSVHINSNMFYSLGITKCNQHEADNHNFTHLFYHYKSSKKKKTINFGNIEF